MRVTRCRDVPRTRPEHGVGDASGVGLCSASRSSSREAVRLAARREPGLTRTSGNRRLARLSRHYPIRTPNWGRAAPKCRDNVAAP